MAVATAAVHAWPGAPGVALVGTVPGGLPVPSVPTAPWAEVVALLPAALAIAVVGYADNVLTARSVADRQGAAALAVPAATALLRRARHQGRRSGGPTA